MIPGALDLQLGRERPRSALRRGEPAPAAGRPDREAVPGQAVGPVVGTTAAPLALTSGRREPSRQTRARTVLLVRT